MFPERMTPMIYSPNALMKGKARQALQNNWQTALLVCFFASLPGLLGQVMTIITGGDAATRMSEGLYTLMVQMESGYIPDDTAAIMNAVYGQFDSAFVYATVGTLVLGLFTPMLMSGLYHYLMELLRGKPGEVRDVLSRKNLFFKAIGLNLLIALKILLWALPGFALMLGGTFGSTAIVMNLPDASLDTVMNIFMIVTYVSYAAVIIPVIMASFRYAMASYHLADVPADRLRDCIAESKKLMKNRKMSLFSLQFSFIGWHLLVSVVSMLLQSMFGYVIGQTVNMFLSLALTLYTQTAVCCFYLLLKDPSQLGVRKVDPTQIPGFQQPPENDDLN